MEFDIFQDTFFTINCFDWDKDGSHDLIGSLHTTLREFTFGPVQMPLVDPEMVGKYVTLLCFFPFDFLKIFDFSIFMDTEHETSNTISLT
jgi:hypothetical protein